MEIDWSRYRFNIVYINSVFITGPEIPTEVYAKLFPFPEKYTPLRDFWKMIVIFIVFQKGDVGRNYSSMSKNKEVEYQIWNGHEE